MAGHSRKPRAIHLDAVRLEGPGDAARKPAARKPRAASDMPEMVMLPDEAVDGDPGQSAETDIPAVSGGISWAGILFLALSALASLAIGLAIDQFIRDMFERHTWLGWIASGLALLAIVAALALAVRELWGILRLRKISGLRERAQAAHDQDDARLAGRVVEELERLFSARPDTAHGRTLLAQNSGEIIDGSDLIALVERDLLAPLDAQARTMVMDSAKRVSVVTAISPRALIDLVFVLMENMRLIRRISLLYGGRPGTIGFWRIARNVVTHLAATGAIAVGDSVVQQLLGHGLAARLSARLGEGVINGMLTARIGISAIDVCRPVPFINGKRPGISDFLGELVRLDGLQKAQGSESFRAPGRGVATERNMK